MAWLKLPTKSVVESEMNEVKIKLGALRKALEVAEGI